MRMTILATIGIAGVSALGVGPPTLEQLNNKCADSNLGCYT